MLQLTLDKNLISVPVSYEVVYHVFNKKTFIQMTTLVNICSPFVFI